MLQSRVSLGGEAFSVIPEQRSLKELDSFLNNPGWDELAAEFSNKPLPVDTDERLVVLRGLAANWDFRNGAERQAVNWDDSALGDEDSALWKSVFRAGDKLHMVQDGVLHNKSPKYLAILGGANKAPFDRLRFGLEAAEDFEHVVYLGASRSVLPAEREKAKAYAPDAKTEFDLGSGAFKALLGAKLTDDFTIERDGDTWGLRAYDLTYKGTEKTGFVLSTPTTIHGKRATTYDNFKFFADRAELSKDPEATVAAITTAFYVPGQHLAAVQELTLPYGTPVETIGHSAGFSGVRRTATQILQEAKSGVDAAVRLDAAIQACYRTMTDF